MDLFPCYNLSDFDDSNTLVFAYLPPPVNVLPVGAKHQESVLQNNQVGHIIVPSPSKGCTFGFYLTPFLQDGRCACNRKL